MTHITREQVFAFIAGREVSEEVAAEIEAMLDEEDSLLWKVSKDVEQKTRIALDPERGPFGFGWSISDDKESAAEDGESGARELKPDDDAEVSQEHRDREG